MSKTDKFQSYLQAANHSNILWCNFPLNYQRCS